MENKIAKICEFYSITHKLKTTLRSGMKLWAVDTDRYESVAEHIYGTQMLALAINSEFDLGLDISKVALMLAIHELGECIIGDIPAIDTNITREQKSKLELAAVIKILSGISSSENILNLFMEFEERQTKEAKFAYLIDKLECDFQCKFYEETGCNDLDKARPQICKELLKPYLDQGYDSLASIWINNDMKKIFDQEPFFKSIANYILENKIFNTN